MINNQRFWLFNSSRKLSERPEKTFWPIKAFSIIKKCHWIKAIPIKFDKQNFLDFSYLFPCKIFKLQNIELFKKSNSIGRINQVFKCFAPMFIPALFDWYDLRYLTAFNSKLSRVLSSTEKYRSIVWIHCHREIFLQAQCRLWIVFDQSKKLVKRYQITF